MEGQEAKERNDEIIKSPMMKGKQAQTEYSGKIRKRRVEDQEFKLSKSVLTENNPEVRRNPKRQVGIKNYEETEEPQADRYVYCDFCQDTFLDCCPKCGQLAFLKDTVLEMGVENRARLTLPNNSVEILPSKIHGLGVFAKVVLKKGIKMGPYQGITTRVESTSGYSWKLRNGFLVDAGDEKNSNWMRYVNCARHFKEQNLMAFQYKGELYYRTCRDVQPGQELLVYYGNNFAMNLGIDVKSYFKPKEDNIVENGRYCQFCRIGYKDSSRLDNHIILCKSNPANFKKPPDKIFTCRFCSIGITDEEYFEKHENRCARQCQKDKENIKGQNIVQRNVKRKRTAELREVKFSCSKCEYNTKILYNMKHHERIHEEKSLFVCSVCQKGFNQRPHLQEHMYVHLDIAENIQIVNSTKICENYGTKTILKALIMGNYVKITTYGCSHCKYVTIYISQLKLHINSKHTRAVTFKCHLCPYLTSQKSNLRVHQNVVHIKNFTWKCDKCDYKASSNSDLKRHIKAIHDKIKDHQCGICSYKASQRSDLKVHLHSVHLNDKKYKCELCDYSTTQKIHLNCHINALHLKNVKYECVLCTYSSYWKTNFYSHMKTKHQR